MGLKIGINSNFKIINFLDVTLNLNDNSYKPFWKTNTIPTFINVSSNHPTSIIKQIPNVIDIRINRLSTSKNIFDNHKEFYNEAIHNSEYKNELKYLEANRHQNIWDNKIGNNRTNNNINMWCNGYRRREWTRRHEFKSWTRLIAVHIALIPLGKVWIQLFSLQLWVNSRADLVLRPWWGN